MGYGSGAGVVVDDVTIEKNTSGALTIKNYGLGNVPFYPHLKQAGNLSGLQMNATQLQGFYYYSDSINNYGDFNVFLAKGTYTLYVLSRRDTNAGIITAYLDGVDVGTYDLYGSGYSNYVRTISNIVVDSSGLKILKLKTTSKNASSSGYYNFLTHGVLIRTA